MILDDKRYFLIGEKGTGKTAYATLLSNTEHKNTAALVKSIIETDYRKFINLRSKKHLEISEYADIWRVILLLVTATHILRTEKSGILTFMKFKVLKDAIDEFYNNAFSPELAYALDFVEKSEEAAKLLTKHANLQASATHQIKGTSHNFQINLMYIRKLFEEGIASLRLDSDHIIFIDGVDIRPSSIEFGEYIECIKGLAQAVWSLYTEFFCNIRGSRGRIKIILLLRPDIFGTLAFQNANAKIRDNSVYLDWRTTYDDYRTSRIFKLIDGILGKQQFHPSTDLATGEIWDRYFPYKVQNRSVAEREDNPFIGFLRYSLYRPRDIISYLLIMQEHTGLHSVDKKVFSDDTFKRCQQLYSDYLLGEIKDQIDFFYTDCDFANITYFFSYFGGRSFFDYRAYCAVYDKYRRVVEKRQSAIPELVGGPEKFLQFLYSLNIIGFRERTEAGDFYPLVFSRSNAS